MHALLPEDSTPITAKRDSTKISLLEMLPRALASLDQPTMDGINTFVVSKAVKMRA